MKTMALSRGRAWLPLKKKTPHLALEKRHKKLFPERLVPRGVRERMRPVPMRGPSDWCVGSLVQPGYRMSDKHHFHLGRAHLVRGHNHDVARSFES